MYLTERVLSSLVGITIGTTAIVSDEISRDVLSPAAKGNEVCENLDLGPSGLEGMLCHYQIEQDGQVLYRGRSIFFRP